MTETVAFSMHPHLLWDVINKQAGSLSKAILEGVTNSIDAGATKCDVTIERDTIRIVDDGRGFQSEKEVRDYFAAFGQPHQEGDAKFGRFRMGRGQMMAFGVNIWISNIYRMDVNLKPQEAKVLKENGKLGFTFSQLENPVKGCDITIKLYEKLTPSQVNLIIRDIGENLAWLKEAVFVNGTKVSKDPASAKWTEETTDGWIKTTSQSHLSVYNQGVFVAKFPANRFGAGGVVVSKKKLDVNFARNDIQSTCKVWKKLSALLKERQTAENLTKTKLNDAERENLVDQFKAGEIDAAEGVKLKLLTDVTGTHYPLTKLTTL